MENFPDPNKMIQKLLFIGVHLHKPSKRFTLNNSRKQSFTWWHIFYPAQYSSFFCRLILHFQKKILGWKIEGQTAVGWSRKIKSVLNGGQPIVAVQNAKGRRYVYIELDGNRIKNNTHANVKVITMKRCTFPLGLIPNLFSWEYWHFHNSLLFLTFKISEQSPHSFIIIEIKGLSSFISDSASTSFTTKHIRGLP